MNKDRVAGKIDEIAGSAKRHVGIWTGNANTEAAGAVQEIKGKAETAVGKLEDAVHDAKSNIEASNQSYTEAEREKRQADLPKDEFLL